ncbi:MAG: hypothetical protein KDD42_03460 [Bdellovibrionales bacterium]|nr:hypothetical protein [Bdellovibrionales bacterium]
MPYHSLYIKGFEDWASGEGLDPLMYRARIPEQLALLIERLYWKRLTRCMDGTGLPELRYDPKISDGLHIYVPAGDQASLCYYNELSNNNPDLNLKVSKLPENFDPCAVRQLDASPGLLALGLANTNDGKLRPRPFIVPGGRFNEMYGWDSYFIVVGLLSSGKYGLARCILENALYQVEHYGCVLNANKTYYLSRSHPPLLSSMLIAVLEATPQSEQPLLAERGLAAIIDEYLNVWDAADHRTLSGLTRYFDRGSGVPPEVEAGHFEPIFNRFAEKLGIEAHILRADYCEGRLFSEDLDRFFRNDGAMRESGHDTSYRLLDNAAELNTLDLNSLLCKVESDIALIIKRYFGKHCSVRGAQYSSRDWEQRAIRRCDRVNSLLWSSEAGLYFDYNFKIEEQSTYVSATTLFPLFAGIVPRDRSTELVRQALHNLECMGGLVCGTESSRGAISENRPLRQWDYPFGWAPHQILAWEGLSRYGFDMEAERLAYRWAFMIAREALRHNGAVAEKYDVVRDSLEIEAEYGNIGAHDGLESGAGFGWSNASFLIAISILRRNPALLERLNQL